MARLRVALGPQRKHPKALQNDLGARWLTSANESYTSNKILRPKKQLHKSHTQQKSLPLEALDTTVFLSVWFVCLFTCFGVLLCFVLGRHNKVRSNIFQDNLHLMEKVAFPSQFKLQPINLKYFTQCFILFCFIFPILLAHDLLKAYNPR